MDRPLSKAMVRVLERIQEHLAYNKKSDREEEFMCYALAEVCDKMRGEAYVLLDRKFKDILNFHGISTGGSLRHLVRDPNGQSEKYVTGYDYDPRNVSVKAQCWRFDFLQLLICEAKTWYEP